MASRKTCAPKPTALLRGFYLSLNSAFSKRTDYNASYSEDLFDKLKKYLGAGGGG